MKLLTNLMKLEILNVIRGKFHIVLGITIVAIIGVFYILPSEPAVSQLAEVNNVEVKYLTEPGDETLRDGLMPTMMAFEVAILGFLFIAVTMFQEKEEGTIRSYRVSPGTTFAYAFSKIAVWVVLSVLYGIICSLATVNLGINYLHLIGLVFAISLVLTSIGLIVAVFFNSMSDWFFPGVALLVVNMVPIMAVRTEGFDYSWLKIIPGYHAILGFTKLFENGVIDNFWSVFGGLMIAGIVCFLLSTLVVQRKLMKEGR